MKNFFKRHVKSIRLIPIITFYSINEIKYMKENKTIDTMKKTIERDILLFEGC